MIGKGKAIAHTSASLNYAQEKEKAEVLDKHYLTGENPKEIEQEMQIFQELNGRCKNNTFSFVLSPSIEDGKRLSNAELREVSQSFLSKMGLDQHQSITIKHQDREHNHLHIYVNRINMEGQAANQAFIGKRAQRVADEIAQERNLTRAKVKQQEMEQAKLPAKERIQDVFNEALKQSKTPEEFFLNVQKKGVELEKSISKQGQVRGYRVAMHGESFKASEIGNKYTLKKLPVTIDKMLIQVAKQTLSRGLGL